MEVDVPETLSTLSSSLTTLEQSLAPLLAVPLKELLQGNEEEGLVVAPIEAARTQILAAYLIHDLIWIYLKTAGVEPENHPVMAELERVKGYFGKLKAAEAPPAQRLQVDKEAARRFIKAAIGSSRTLPPPDAGPSGTHIRFEGSADEDKQEKEDVTVKAAVEDKAENATPQKAPSSKRPKMDPFAGYDQPQSAAPSPATKKPKGAKGGPSPGKTASPAAAAGKGAEGNGGSSPAVSKHQKKKAQAAKMKKGGAGAGSPA